MASPFFGAPIPGENFTSNTKNYPWHRPPDYVDVDSAIDYLSKSLMRKDGAIALVSMLEVGLDVATVTSMIIMKGMSEGKWSLDLGLLLAGPISHMIVIMAKGYKIEYDLGIDNTKHTPTKAFFNAVKKDVKTNDKKNAELEKEAKDMIQKPSGFAGGMDSMEDSMDSEEPQETETEDMING